MLLLFPSSHKYFTFRNLVRHFLFYLFLIYFLFFWPHHEACGILVPQPGIEPGPSTVRAWSPNHWTAREFPDIFYFFINDLFFCLIINQ